MTQRQQDIGDWTLTFEPKAVCSVTVSARTSMDILPVFYLPDDRSFQPSLQRVQDHPSQGVIQYIVIVKEVKIQYWLSFTDALCSTQTTRRKWPYYITDITDAAAVFLYFRHSGITKHY